MVLWYCTFSSEINVVVNTEPHIKLGGTQVRESGEPPAKPKIVDACGASMFVLSALGPARRNFAMDRHRPSVACHDFCSPRDAIMPR